MCFTAVLSQTEHRNWPLRVVLEMEWEPTTWGRGGPSPRGHLWRKKSKSQGVEAEKVHVGGLAEPTKSFLWRDVRKQEEECGCGRPGEGERPRSIPRLRSLSLIVSLGFPSKGSRVLGSLLLAPLFPYLFFQPFPHSPASSAAPEVTRNSRTAQRQKGSTGAGERVPMRLTAPACGRGRSKRLPEAVEVRSFPGLPLSEYARARFKEASNTGVFSTL